MSKAYISLGANEGKRLENIQEAVTRIQNKIGNLIALSSLYQTPSLGFEGPDFLNACIEIDTILNPLDVLDKLLEIERAMGREPLTKKGYQSRPIDLDLLFYEEQIINLPVLILPHPRIAQRNFVLYPLNEINPELMHPILKKTIIDLLSISPDKSEPKKSPLSDWSPACFERGEILIFEGNIGVGKTSLAQKIARHYKVPFLEENFEENPFLKKFYDDPVTYALDLENHFMENRFKQFQSFFNDSASSSGGVADHSPFRSLIFAKINLSTSDFDVFEKHYLSWSKTFSFPKKVIFLKHTIGQLKKNIIIRGRPYEQKITVEYLKKIELGYQSFFNHESEFDFCTVDLSDLDFVKLEAAYQIILLRIKAFLAFGKNPIKQRH
tara:strand:- start:272 stop:1417 length:1146 start_codon:yes stop_codon:yes gene_type:complete